MARHARAVAGGKDGARRGAGFCSLCAQRRTDVALRQRIELPEIVCGVTTENL